MSKLILGVATNSKGHYKAKHDGKMTKSYTTWFNMLLRAYCPKLHARHPTYLGCSVAGEWLEYQRFAEWYEAHEYSNRGYELDKDLLIPGNKVYAPDHCVFVPSQLNNLLTDSKAIRGQYKQGVCWHKPSGRYLARVSAGSKREFLGYFDCPQEAYQAYKIAKEANVKRMALEWQDRIASDVFDALMRWELTLNKGVQ